LRGVTFALCNDPNGRRGTGLIAQEVQAVLPEAVRADSETGLLSVAYGNVVGLLVEAIHQLGEELAHDEGFLRLFSGDIGAATGPMRPFGWATGYALSIYGTAGNGPNVQPADATIDNPPADLFTKAGWAEFASGFWLGGCGGAAFAWFLASTAVVAPLVNIAGGVWSVG